MSSGNYPLQPTNEARRRHTARRHTHQLQRARLPASTPLGHEHFLCSARNVPFPAYAALKHADSQRRPCHFFRQRSGFVAVALWVSRRNSCRFSIPGRKALFPTHARRTWRSSRRAVRNPMDRRRKVRVTAFARERTTTCCPKKVRLHRGQASRKSSLPPNRSCEPRFNVIKILRRQFRCQAVTIRPRGWLIMETAPVNSWKFPPPIDHHFRALVTCTFPCGIRAGDAGRRRASDD